MVMYQNSNNKLNILKKFLSGINHRSFTKIVITNLRNFIYLRERARAGEGQRERGKQNPH